MKITAINNYQTSPNFMGEKKNKLKNAAGAAAIAMAVAVPVEKVDAQVFYYPPVNPYTVVVPSPVINSVPDCFVVGDMSNFNINKSMGQVFQELDKNQNGEISAKEVVIAQRNNWNLNNIYPYNKYQMNNDAAEFRTISNLYDDENSNPETMNYGEYRAAMNDYMKAKNVNAFINLMRLFALPGAVCPPPHIHVHPIPTPPPRHHHHHHRHW